MGCKEFIGLNIDFIGSITQSVPTLLLGTIIRVARPGHKEGLSLC